MSGTTIWLNRNYATTVHLIHQLRRNPQRRTVRILGSHKDPASPMLSGCDARFVEPALTGPEYAEHALRFCDEHDVDVFLPVYEQLAIARRAADFRRAGVALIAPPADAVELLSDKAATYRAVGHDSELTPPWREIRTADEFETAIAELAEFSGSLVIKPTRGVGATGVRMLSDAPPNLDELTGPVTHSATIQDFIGALKTEEAAGRSVAPLMVLPYLSEPEISVDVLARAGRTVAAVPRAKRGRARSLHAPAEVLDAADQLVAIFALEGLVNVQFRFLDGRPVLLEINTRPSGGLYQTGLAQVNLPWAAVQQALGEPTEPLRPVLGGHYVTVSSMVQV